MKKIFSILLVIIIIGSLCNFNIYAENTVTISDNITTDGFIEIKSTEDVLSNNEFVLIENLKYIKMFVLSSTDGRFVLVPEKDLIAGNSYTLRDSLGKINYQFTAKSNNSDTQISIESNVNVSVSSNILVNSNVDLTNVTTDTVTLHKSGDSEYYNISVSYDNCTITINPANDLDKGTVYTLKINGVKDDSNNVIRQNIVFKTEAPPTVDVYPGIKNSEHTTSQVGSWGSSGVKGFNNSATLYSTGGTEFSWIPMLENENYKVLFWLVFHTSDTVITEAEFDIKHADGVSKVIIPIDKTGPNGFWADLGTYNFSKGNSNYVKLIRDASRKHYRINYVRFEPVQDTSIPVATVNYDGVLKVTFSKPMKDNVLYCTLNGETAILVSDDNINYALVHQLEKNTEYSFMLENAMSFDGYQVDLTSETFITNKSVKMPVLFEETAESIVYETYLECENVAEMLAYKIDANGFISGQDIATIQNGVLRAEVLGGTKDNTHVILLKNSTDFKPYPNTDEVSQISINASYENQILTIESQSQNHTPGESVVFSIFNKNNQLIYIKEVKMAESGINTITIDIPDGLDGGDYAVVVNSESASAKADDSFYNINSSTIARAVEELNGCLTSSTVEDVVSRLYRELQLGDTDTSNYWSINRTNINNKIIDATFNNSEDVTAFFKKLVAVEALNQKSDHIAIVNEYKDLFGVDLTLYNTLSQKTAVNTLIAEYLPLSIPETDDFSAIKTAFDKSVALQIVNDSSWGVLDTIFNDYKSLLEINLESYDDLTDAEKTLVAKAIKEKNYTKISEFVLAFNNAVSNADIPPSPGYVSNGGGGGGGMIVVGTPPKAEPETVKPTVVGPIEYGFVDIDEIAWAKESIQVLFEKGIIDGYEDRTFRGNEPLTREAFVKMIVNAFDLAQHGEAVSFRDVADNHWAVNYVSIAASNGIVNGISENEFGMGRQITRQDMAVILYRAIKTLGIELPETSTEINFVDAVDISKYAVEAISTLQRAGIINGVSENEYAPQNNTTRAMATKVIYETLNQMK